MQINKYFFEQGNELDREYLLPIMVVFWMYLGKIHIKF